MSGFYVPADTQTINVTVAAEQLYHYITDGELEKLGDMNKDPVSDICLVLCGGFLGLVVPSVQAITKFLFQEGFGGLDLVTMGLSSATFFGSVITGYLWRVKSQSHATLKEEIRSRPKVTVIAAAIGG